MGVWFSRFKQIDDTSEKVSFIKPIEDELQEIRGLFHHRLEVLLLLTRVDYLEVYGSLLFQGIAELQRKIFEKKRNIMLLIGELSEHLDFDEMSWAKRQVYEETIDELRLCDSKLEGFHFELETKKCLARTVLEDARGRVHS